MSETVRVACPHDCPDTCAMLVTVDDGVATKIQGDPQAPFTEGTLCTKVSHYLERTYSADRLKYPMRRIGRKGEGKFERISWDAALDEIAARLKALAAEDPQTILPCSYAGTMGMVQYSSMDRRFFYRLGASLLDRTLCSSAGKYVKVFCNRRACPLRCILGTPERNLPLCCGAIVGGMGDVTPASVVEVLC